MLPVPAKSSETRAILLLVSGETEHLWIRIENVVVKVRATSKKSLTDVRFGAHYGLTSDIVPGPKSANKRLIHRSKASFDHPVSACEHSVRNKKAERLGGLEVEGEERTREN